MRFMVYAPTKGVPPLGAVMTPSMTRTYAGWSSRGQIYGAPGTVGIPAPRPDSYGMNLPYRMDGAGDSRSVDSPDIWYPSIYFENNDPKNKAPVSTKSDNQMPVPALRPPNVLKADPYRTRLGGQRQVYQPQVVQKWPGMRGTSYA